MKLITLTAAFFPNLNPGRMFLMSARRQRLNVIPYGMGEVYCIWADMKILKKIPVLKGLDMMGYTHVLYSDFRDVIVLGSREEIIAKYEAVGSPACFVSGEPTCNPSTEYAHHYPDPGTLYRYPSPGGYLAEIPWMITMYERMATYRDRSGDDSEIWQWAWAEGWFCPAIDTQATIWQTWADCQDDIEVLSGLDFVGGLVPRDAFGYIGKEARIRNKTTGTWPVIFHMQGDYSDPEYGKYDAMLPYWRAFYPDIEVTRESVKP